MSYCRWGDNSNVYMFYHMDGYYSINVASSRATGPSHTEELFSVLNDVPTELPFRATPIGLAHDGEQFMADTPEDALNTLLMLANEGYLVPQHPIDRLQEEIAEKCG